MRELSFWAEQLLVAMEIHLSNESHLFRINPNYFFRNKKKGHVTASTVDVIE